LRLPTRQAKMHLRNRDRG